MNDYHSPRKHKKPQAAGAQAMALRQQVAELDELVHHPIYRDDEPEKHQKEADRLWLEHVELLKQVYPKPDSRDHIQVTLRDIYRDDAIVLSTSFANMNEYNKAYAKLGWDYELVSSEVGICECCDEYYLVKDGCQDKEGRGFCKLGCLEEDEFERQIEADEQEIDLAYDLMFPIGDIYDRDVPQW